MIDIKLPRQCSEDSDYLRFKLITFVFRYTPYQDDEAYSTRKIWVLRKPTRVFYHYDIYYNNGQACLRHNQFADIIVLCCCGQIDPRTQ